MIISEERVWAGSETSLHAARQAEANIVTRVAGPADLADQADPEDEVVPRLLSVDNGIATITIKGPLVNSDSPWLEMFGLTGYPEIRDAVIAAASDLTVSQILLDIDSGGGSVSGVDDTANLIRTVNDQVKPVTTYTDGVMASAAYWLGCSAGEVYSGKAAMVGSIGVIATFREFTEANKMEGVTVTVIRAGKEKALANSNEKLTPAAEAQIQQMVDASYGVFVDHVAAMRKQPYAYADKAMADGQEFIGKAAVDVGLTDGITTFDAVMSDLSAKVIASSNNLMHNRGNGGSNFTGSTGETAMARKALSELDIAALAAGGTQVVAHADTPEEIAAAEAVAATAEAALATAAAAETGAAASLETVVAEQVANTNATVQLLNSQLQAKDADLLAAGIKMAKLDEQLGQARATHAPLLEIAVKSLNNMQVALGGSAMKCEGLDAVTILAQHTSMTEQFQTKFKVGGVAAVSSEDAVSTKQPQANPRHLAHVRGAQFNKGA